MPSKHQARAGKKELPGPAIGEGREPAAEEEDRREAGNGDHVRVFGHEEHGEFEAGIFGVEAGDQFGFRFGQVERNAVRFGNGGGDVAEEADDLRESRASAE